MSEYTVTVFCTVTEPPAGTMGMLAVPFRLFSPLFAVLTSTYFKVEDLASAGPWLVTTTVIGEIRPGQPPSSGARAPSRT